MEITTAQMYLLVMLDSIDSGLCILLCTVGILGLLLLFIAFMDEYFRYPKVSIATLASFVLILAITVIVPNTKQACAILIAPKIINNEQVQKMPNKVLELGSAWLEDLKPQHGEDE